LFYHRIQSVFSDGAFNIRYEPEIKVQIVYGGESEPEYFPLLKKMSQISPGIIAAKSASTI
jgi:hypothetical protein